MKPGTKLKGKITDAEGQALRELAERQMEDERLAELPIVEVGSYMGMSTCYLGSSGARVFAVDMWDMHLGNEDRARNNLKRKIPYDVPATFQTFLKQIAEQGVADNVTWIKGASGEVAKAWSRPIGGLFIDGAHDEKSVKVDYTKWSPFVVEGGWIAFHDATEAKGVLAVLNGIVKPSGLWEDWHYVERLAIARRSASSALGTIWGLPVVEVP